MRLTTVISLAFLMQVSASTLAQRITMDRHGVSLETVLKDIRNQTGYSFVYDVKAVTSAQNVSISVSKAEINDVLKLALRGLDLDYKIDGKIVSIRQKLVVSNVQSPIVVSGKVVDEQGYPLSGISVIVKDTKVGTATDDDGNYIIRVPDANSVLVFSYLGFKTQEIKVKEQNKINITMEMGVSILDEVALISTGYQRIKPEQSTGSISTIQEKQFNSRINTTDFLIGLQNKLPGLLINNDIKYEEEPLFQIRGISTFNGIRKPLIVVDGYPTELDLASINPNEIESVTILKDAAAATIYGARSSNGVIVIGR